MSIIGDKIHRIRDFRGMTQKQLGIAVGFDDKSADVRIAQYESGTRTPKQALVEKLAEVLDVNPRFLADDEILGAEGVMELLFELDEHYPIRSGRDEKKTLLTVRSARPNIQNGSLTGRKRPMTAENMNLRKSGATYKPLETQNNSA